jgi:glucoamylase
LCTSAFAELYYRVASALEAVEAVPTDPLTTTFMDQIEGSKASPTDAAQTLRDAGDAMLRGLIFHSDNLELSEQFDRDTGFQRSISNLTWSYASFLSAVRARSQR